MIAGRLCRGSEGIEKSGHWNIRKNIKPAGVAAPDRFKGVKY